MTSTVTPAAAPPRELLFRRRQPLGRSLRELWVARELVRTLAERELRARYKQAVLGFLWAVVAPLVLMVVFTVFFKRVARVETEAPYPLFAYLGLLPWGFFSTSLSSGGLSLITNMALLNKVHCPREVFPLGSVLVALFDLVIGVLILGLLFAMFTFAPQTSSFWVPILFAIQLAFTVGATLSVSSIVVYLRDLRHALPLLLQVGLFATPVAYGIEGIPPSVRPAYSFLNPLVPVIDGYRRTVLYGQSPRMELLALAAAGAAVWLVGGYVLFKRLETGFADVA